MANVFGTAGNDTITPNFVSPGVINKPTNADDQIWGFDGRDFLDGGLGNDTLRGGRGNDTYQFLNGVDTVEEEAGEGIDKVLTTSSYTLTDHVEKLQLIGSGIINGTGNALDNSIQGNNRANIIDGAKGDDTLIGEGGNDTYYVDSFLDKVVETENEGIDKVLTTRSYTLPAHVEELQLIGNANINGTGNPLDNFIQGNNQANIINGAKGDDTLVGKGGNDTYLVDSIFDEIIETANEGIDTVETAMSYSLEGNPYVENLTLLGAISFGYGNDANNMIDARFARRLPSGTSVDLRGRGGNDTIQGVDSFGTSDRIYGGDQSDWLYGNAGHDRLYGENHMDFLSGGDDNDYLVGGGGTDTLRGDRGNDTLIGNSNAAVSTQGPEFDALWGGPGQDRFVLGNFFGAFYQDAGYAILKDFDRFADTIQLGVFSNFYSLREGQFTGSGNLDTEILYNGNRIALVDGQVGLSLNANYFDFV